MICGDGTQSPDELCDDGNQLAGDGCSSECLPSGMPVDCVDLLVQDNLQDWDSVLDLLPLTDGTFIAAGQLDGSTDKRGWLARFEPTGAKRWFVEATSLDPGIDSITDLTGDARAGIWALATGSSLSNDLVIRFDQDGNAVSTAVVESDLGTSVNVWDIEVTTSGVWLAGEVWIAEDAQSDAWLGLYDPMQDVVQEVLREDHLGYDDAFSAIDRDDEGVVVVATVSTSPNHDEDVILLAKTDILVVWVDSQGHELRRATVGPGPDPDWVRRAGKIASDEAGRWYVGGTLWPFDVNQQNQGWAAQVDGAWAWTSGGARSYWGDMAGVDEGVVVAANHVLADGSGELFYQGWLSEFGLDGAPRWEFGAVGDGVASYRDYSHSVLRGDAQQRIRTAGTVWAPAELTKVRSCMIAR